MKKLYIILFIAFAINFFTNAQTTGVDFSLNDCNGVTQSLFKSLDSGKVVIMIYEHQCSSCVTGSKYVQKVYNSYYATNPNVEIMYLDNGGFNCASISSWINTNALAPGNTIAYSNTYNSPYGTGMPVVVICGPYQHKIYFNASGTLLTADTVHMHHAIDSALMQTTLSVQSVKKNTDNIQIYPNPVTNSSVNINFTSSINQKIALEVIDLTGKSVYSSNDITIYEGNNNIRLSDANLKNGVYFCRFKSTEGISVRKLILNK